MVRGGSKAATSKSKTNKPARNNGQNGEERRVATSVPLEIQQKCLNFFRDALSPRSEDQELLQEVKGHLFNRDFATAFGQEDYLRVYASRWSPSRALGYLQVLVDMQDKILDNNPKRTYNVTCIGGGAGAEVIALAGWLHLQHARDSPPADLPTLQAKFLDIAAWDKIVADLHKATINPPVLSKYASIAAKEANTAMLSEGSYTADFKQIDALTVSKHASYEIFSGDDLITLMFTLNELYATSMPKTQQLLTRITEVVAPGSHLLVVDSPGSYSTVSINGAEKKYPMQWLLNYTLIGAMEKEGSPPKWEKLVSEDSTWFRLPQGLEYPIDLENMRYQIHLYRRLPGSNNR